MAMQMVCGIMRDLDAEAKAYNAKWEQVRLAGLHLKQNELSRICARYELESDEFNTAMEKAQIIKNGGNCPRY